MRAVENALNLEIPLNAQYIRNIIIGAHHVHDHIVHFYHLAALDWVDIVSALKADPKWANAFFNRSICHELKDDLSKAAADLKHYLAQNPGDKDAAQRLRDLQARLTLKGR